VRWQTGWFFSVSSARPLARPLLVSSSMSAVSPVPPHDPFGLIGATLASRYYVEALVAETSLSVVYRAVHCVWHRPVAIKAFRAPRLSEDARRELLDSFVREGALLAELSEQTAAVCQARDVASVTTPTGEWVPYLVLEWLEGEALDVVLTRERADGGRPRSVEEALDLLAPIARALSVAHARGIVHRDIKPGNICVLADAKRTAGPTKLLDFGIATAVRGPVWARHSDDPAVQSFTPAYGAPEQFSSEYGEIGPWTDVFALALVFVELLVGHEALPGEALGQLALSSCNPAWRPTPRALGIFVDKGTEYVLARALSVRPEDRYANAGEFWGALERSREVEPDPALPIPLVSHRAAAAPLLHPQGTC
jgi:eukaryotic-like serine/threonine-protein kinase